jgi:Mg/Co/Ni transporter MgtE
VERIRNDAGYTQPEAAALMEMKYDTFAKKERNGKITVEWAIEFAKRIGRDPSVFKCVFDLDPDENFFGSDKWKKLLKNPSQAMVLTAKSPDDITERLYGTVNNQIKTNTENKPYSEDQKGATYELDATEQCVINIFRKLPKEDRQEVFNFINDKKRGE